MADKDNTLIVVDALTNKLRCGLCGSNYGLRRNLVRHLGVKHGVDDKGKPVPEEVRLGYTRKKSIQGDGKAASKKGKKDKSFAIVEESDGSEDDSKLTEKAMLESGQSGIVNKETAQVEPSDDIETVVAGPSGLQGTGNLEDVWTVYNSDSDVGSDIECVDIPNASKLEETLTTEQLEQDLYLSSEAEVEITFSDDDNAKKEQQVMTNVDIHT